MNNMRKRIFIALIFPLFCLFASAQNPILKTFKVEYRTTEGKDRIVEVSTINDINSFSFVGGKGEVQIYNDATEEWETVEEENRDVYLRVLSVEDFEAELSLGFSDEAEALNVETFGCCISKTANLEVSEFTIDKSINSNSAIKMDSYFRSYGDVCFTMYIREGNPVVDFNVTLIGLDYVTTYYVRPFIKLTNGFVMYGGEKSFTTPRTKTAALDNEEGMDDYFMFEDSIVIQKEAMMELLDEDVEFTYDLWYGMQQDLKYMLQAMTADERVALLKKDVYKTIECVDGNLYLIKDFSSDFVNRFKLYFTSDTVEFGAIEALNLEKSSRVSAVDTVYCDISMGVPYNCYAKFHPAVQTARPEIAINIPKFIHNKEYAVYAVFVHPDSVPPYKVRISMYERQNSSIKGKGSYKSTE